ncbi:MAG: glycine cleavage system protein H [Syntrophobacteraceae bacterium]
MDSKKTRGVVGFNILEDECVWAKAGVVNFKRCTNGYDCNTCQFDTAMFQATQPKAEKARKPSLREALGRKPANARQCRHMLTGRVDNRLCDNDYRCDVCEFDQMLDYVDDVHPTGDASMIEILGYQYADTYYYHGGHTWARLESGGRIRIGVDDFAMRLFGRPDRWECPETGKRIVRDAEALSLVREGNRAGFLSPVSGTVIVVNQKVMDQPALAHAKPYSDGWLVLVEPENIKNIQQLRFGPDGKKWLLDEADRLHDLITRDYGRMAATGASPIDDVFGQVPELGWKALVSEFLRRDSGTVSSER